MNATKSIRGIDTLEITYHEDHWRLLTKLRFETIELMKIMEQAHIHCVTYGSIARGDVSHGSDIDLFVPYIIPSFTIEINLEKHNISINRRFIVQATPASCIKGYIEIGENKSISFPLSSSRIVERGFYKFGGQIDLKGLKENIRVIGIDKRLMIIIPTEKGHTERSILGEAERTAHILRIAPSVVRDRVKALTRREQIGRTGSFIEREIQSGETFEMVLKNLSDQNSAVRRRLRTK